MHLEHYTVKVERWSPEGLNVREIYRIIQNYGIDNDSLLPEETEQNPQWNLIEISIAQDHG